MTKYRLKEMFAGKKAGDIIDFSYDGTYSWSYKKAAILLSREDTELVEKVEEKPLFYTNEDEVYLDGKKEAVYEYQKLYFYGTIGIHKTFASSIPGINNPSTFKYFTTYKAAEDHIKLQEAIKESGLKIGDIIDINRNNYNGMFYNEKIQWSISNTHPSGRINNFKIIKNKFCFQLDFLWYELALYNNKSRLMFGDKEVILKLNNKKIFEDYIYLIESIVTIECEGEIVNYSDCKKLREAITIIKEFKFGNKKLEYSFNTFKLGCTIGTIEQIDNILKACEELMK